MAVMHVLNSGKNDMADVVYARMEELGDVYPVRNGAQGIVYDLWYGKARDRGKRLYWRQPLDRPTIGETITFAAYVDRQGNWHLRLDAVKRRLDAGTSHAVYSAENGGLAAAWIWPALAWNPGDALFRTLDAETKRMFDLVDDGRLDPMHWNVFRDAILDDGSIGERDRKMVELRTKQALEAITSLEFYEKRALELEAEKERERVIRMASESYEERERRERGQRLDPADYPEPGGVLT
jgi:hypothetical protein